MDDRAKPDQLKGDPKRRASDPPKPSQYGLPVNVSGIDIDENDETEILEAEGEGERCERSDRRTSLIWDELSAELAKQSGVTTQYIQLAVEPPLDDGPVLDLEGGILRTQRQEIDDAGQTNEEMGLDMRQPARERSHEESEDGLNPTPTLQGVRSRMELTLKSGAIAPPPSEAHGIKDSENTRVIKFKEFLREGDLELSDSRVSSDYDSESDSDEENEEDEEEEMIGPEEPRYSPHQQKIRDYLYEISEV